MKNVTKTTPQTSSTSCIHRRGRASLTAESTCWVTCSRYGLHTGVCESKLFFVSFVQLLSCHCREGRRLPSTETLAPSWAWGPSSGSLRNWRKTSEKVRLWPNKRNEPALKMQLIDGNCSCPPARPRVCQLTRHGVRPGPQQESGFIHPRHWA